MYKILSFLALVLGTGLFIIYWFRATFSNFTLNPFDGAGRFLFHSWVSKGLIPFVDFYSVYPPGLAILIGKIVPYTSFPQRNLNLGIFCLAIIIVNLIIFYKIFTPPKLDYYLTGLFLGLASIPMTYLWGDPLILLLIQTNLLASWWHQEKRRVIALILVFLSIFSITWLRWDWPVLLVFFQTFTLVILSFFHKKFEFAHARLVWVANLSGLITGLLSLLIYMSMIGASKYAYDLLFKFSWSANPRLYSQLSRINLPSSLTDDSWAPFLIFSFLIGFTIITIFSRHRLVKHLWWWLPGAAFLFIYGLSHLDGYHLYQYGYVLGSVFFLMQVKFHFRPFTSLIYIFLFFPLISEILVNLPHLDLTPKNALAQSTREIIADCRRLVGDLSSYKSIFIGRHSYAEMGINIMALHFLNTSLRPASRFVYELAGVQNTCYYGAQIARELKEANKPMVAFIYTKSPGDQSEIPLKVQSCMHIENYLTSSKYQIVGTCQSWGRTFVVRRYE